MTTATLGIVNAPPAEPPLVGLLASLKGTSHLHEGDALTADIDDNVGGGLPAGLADGDHWQRWQGGVSYLPEQTGPPPQVADPCDSSTQLAIPASPNRVDAMPMLAWAGDVCSTFGWNAHNFQRRATNALLAAQSKQIARELWNGTQAQESGWPNPYLTNNVGNTGGGDAPAVVTLTSVAVDPNIALQIIEGGLADSSNGQQGMIHCTREVASALSELGNTFRNANGVIQTWNGTIICPDAGYTGEGPGNTPPGSTSQWMYATLVPDVWLGPITVFPDTYEEAIIRLTNSLEFRAERLAIVTFPPTTLLAAEVNATKPLNVAS